MRLIYRHSGKRLLDLGLTIPALVVLSPILGVIAALVRVWLGSPVLFRQQRPGLRGQPFTLHKFRTMTDARDADGNLLPDCPTPDPLGRLLRSTSLDELPELWNVLRGEMSLVGPRPLMMRYLDRYTPSRLVATRSNRPIARLGAGQRAPCRHLGAEVRARTCGTWIISALARSGNPLLTVPRVITSSGVISGQSVSEVDDVGLSRP